MELIDRVKNGPDGLSKTLGITYHATDDPETIEARLTCTEGTSQPWGYLSGGATLALAENVAGMGSMCLCPDKVLFGINVSANHMSSARIGETVIATARIIRQGGRLHHWLVEVRHAETGAMVSEIMVTNYVKEVRG